MRGEERKEQILQAAARAFATYGYEQTSIARICEALGIGRGTLYQYFDDKKSIFRELIVRHGEHIQALANESAFDLTSVEQAREVNYRRHLALARDVVANRDLYAVFFSEAKAKNAEVEELVRTIEESLVATVQRSLALSSERGICVVPDPEFTAVYFVGGIFKVFGWYLIQSKPTVSPEQLANQITELQLRCIAPR